MKLYKPDVEGQKFWNPYTQTMPREDDPAAWGRVSRNAPCPCGSGKKYKHCHGALNA